MINYQTNKYVFKSIWISKVKSLGIEGQETSWDESCPAEIDVRTHVTHDSPGPFQLKDFLQRVAFPKTGFNLLPWVHGACRQKYFKIRPPPKKDNAQSLVE